MDRIDPPNVLCPSARLNEGAILVGIVTADGTVAFAADRLVVNRDFVANARQGRSPEKRFRFADLCVKSACRQWSTDRCGVIDQVVAGIPVNLRSPGLPQCSIRPQCRWFSQSGADACRVCSLVVTDCLEAHPQPIAGVAANS